MLYVKGETRNFRGSIGRVIRRGSYEEAVIPCKYG